jgi:secondary thiamine-phosphate synthase enzyme
MLRSFTIETRAAGQLINISEDVRGILRNSGVQSGVVRVFVPHTTAAVTINENADPTVVHDILEDLDRLVPISQTYYRHREGNSAAHLKASLIGACQTIVVEGGEALLGTWQGIYFCEFDGPRRRTVHVKVTGDYPGAA